MNGGPVPPILQLVNSVKIYGAQAVIGRTLYAHEIFRMDAARSIVEAFNSRKASENWATWAGKHPHQAEILAYIEKLINE